MAFKNIIIQTFYSKYSKIRYFNGGKFEMDNYYLDMK